MISSFLLVGQLQEMLDFSQIYVCLDDQNTSFSSNFDVNTLISIRNPPNTFLERKYNDIFTATGICAQFTGSFPVLANKFVNMTVDHTKFSSTLVYYTIYYTFNALDMTALKMVPITQNRTYIQDIISPQNFLFTFGKYKYNLTRTTVQVKPTQYNELVYGGFQAGTDGTTNYIQLEFTGYVNYYTIACSSLTSIFSAVSGVSKVIFAVLAFVLGDYFYIAFLQALSKMLKPSDNTEEIGLFKFLANEVRNLGKDTGLPDKLKSIHKKFRIETYLQAVAQEPEAI